MNIFLLVGVPVEIGLVFGAWRWWRRRDLNALNKWRTWIAKTSLLLVSATTGTFVFHLFASVYVLRHWHRGAFDLFVELSLLAALLALVTSLFAKGAVRYSIGAASLLMASFWTLVAAFSYM